MRALESFVLVSSFRRVVGAALLVAATVAVSSPRSLQAQTPAVLHQFTNDGTNGAHSVAALVQAADGSFYGTTARGGSSNNGTVFRLAPDSTFTVLFAFDGGLAGGEPVAALVPGGDGSFYGTTEFGGYYNHGTAFRITPNGTLTTLFSFGGDYGSEPVAALVLGPDGNLYGTTQYGGIYGNGTVFQLTTSGTLNVLFDFGGDSGSEPATALIFGADGSLYGTTQYGGYNDQGTVFQITTTGNLTVLHDFSLQDGVNPAGALSFVPGAGTVLYGTASTGGNYGYGTVFQITTAGVFTKLHDFNGADGSRPEAALLPASDGQLYGTTYYGGAGTDQGSVYKLSPTGAFSSVSILTRATGQYPAAPLIQGFDGAFYGTTYGGGSVDDGTIFRLDFSLPAPEPAFFNGAVSVGNGVEYLTLPNGNVFGYFSFLPAAQYLYHFDLGYEYVFDAADGFNGIYLYDFKSQGFFYTSPTFPFPYLYDFSLNSVVYYYPNPTDPTRYNTGGQRFFYVFSTGRIISK